MRVEATNIYKLLQNGNPQLLAHSITGLAFASLSMTPCLVEGDVWYAKGLSLLELWAGQAV